MSNVVLYTKSYCPYSKSCKEFLQEKGVAYTEKMVDGDANLENEMLAKSDHRTDTPQVFINGHHIGSFDDLKALEALGKLDEMLKS